MLLEQIKTDLNEALKSGDQAKVSALRYLLSQIQNREIFLRIPSGQILADEEVISVLRQQVKQRNESIEAFRSGGRNDLVEKELAELDILNKYLPQGMGEKELEKIVQDAVSKMFVGTAPTSSDFGKIMGQVMSQLKGQADGEIVAKIVKETLQV